MKKPWYLRAWIWVLIIVFILVIPILINESYNSDTVLYVTQWGATDVLSFYGTVLSFVGTVVLGIVALEQSRKANQLSERMLKAEERREIPIIDVGGVLPEEITEVGVLGNALHVIFNDYFYFFQEDNTLGEADTEVYVFRLENISTTHIISFEIVKISANTYYDNGERFPITLDKLGYSSGLQLLRIGESQYMIIGGINPEGPHLSDDEMCAQKYTSPRIELELTFRLRNAQGRLFEETIRIMYINTTNIADVRYPCVIEKELLRIKEIDNHSDIL